jgi:predicted Fe-Mo cluster-binding NifX family protein
MTSRIRIAVPTEGVGGIDAPRSGHFGRAGSFTLVDVEDGAMVSSGTILNPPHEHGGCGLIVGTLADLGVGAVIVAGMGGGPRSAMASRGIDALHDVASLTPRQSVESYLSGSLRPFGADDRCGGH